MTDRPGIAPAQPWSFPLPEISTLDNGMAVWVYDLPGQFIVSCDLVLELPLNAEPAGIEGVATITSRCLDEGTLAHPGPAFAAALEDVAAQFSSVVGLSTTRCLLDLPYDTLGPGLALFAEAVTSPGFDPDDVYRIRTNRLMEIEQQESRGAFVASAALRRHLVAEHLRGGRPGGGEADQVAMIGADDVSRFHLANYAARESTLVIAGDMTGVDAVAHAAAAFGDWNPVPAPAHPETLSPGTPRREVIHRDGAVQADIRFGWYGIDRRDPRWEDLQVALAVMGGMFNSRLNTVLREERGYSYGVSMNARPFRAGGLIDIATSTRTASAQALIDETLAILSQPRPFTGQEVADAIGYLTLSAPLFLDTAEAVAAQAATLVASRLDPGYVTRSLRSLARVTPESAWHAYQSLIDTGRASIVVVTDTTATPAIALS